MAEQNKWSKKGIAPEGLDPEKAMAAATKKAEKASQDMRSAKGSGSFGGQKEEAAPATAAPTPAAPSMKEYTVVSGDSLSLISEKHYGTQGRWKEIYEANKETIGDNPSLIRVGQLLQIPQ